MDAHTCLPFVRQPRSAETNASNTSKRSEYNRRACRTLSYLLLRLHCVATLSPLLRYVFVTGRTSTYALQCLIVAQPHHPDSSLCKESNRPEVFVLLGESPQSLVEVCLLLVRGPSKCHRQRRLFPLLLFQQQQYSEKVCPAFFLCIAFLSHRSNHGVVLSLHHKEVGTNQHDGYQRFPNTDDCIAESSSVTKITDAESSLASSSMSKGLSHAKQHRVALYQTIQLHLYEHSEKIEAQLHQ